MGLVEKHGLLAKWRLDGIDEGYRWARGYTYNGHMFEVLDATQFLFNVKDGVPGAGPPERRFRDGSGKTHPSMGHALHAIMGIEEIEGVDITTFHRWCFLASLAHDLGKAGGEFQTMMWTLEVNFQWAVAKRRGLTFNAGAMEPFQDLKLTQEEAKGVWADLKKCSRYKQAYRHEFLSALLMFHHREIRAWFEQEAGSKKGFLYVLAGAFGHHLKAEQEKAFRKGNPATHRDIYLKEMSKRLRALLQKPALGFGGSPFPLLEDWKKHEITKDEKSLVNAFTKMGTDRVGSETFNDLDEDRVSAAIKWIVILSDTLGSISQAKKDGTWETTPQARRRIYRDLAAAFGPSEVGYYQRVSDRLLGLDQDEKKVSRDFDAEDVQVFVEDNLREMQRECAGVEGNLLTCASTGGGKTIAAFMWASRHPHKRLLFTTPTTDTATRLYLDYADMECDFLRHSRARMDQPRIRLQSTPEDTPEDDAEEEADAQIVTDVFATYGQDIAFTTADQVLGVLAFYRKSVMWLPYILSAQIVFDEFHSYDPIMWGWYLRFLEWFPGLRTAHMSATVPDYLRKQVEERIFVREAGRAIRDPRGQGEPSCLPRYRIRVVTEQEAQASFDAGTLWIHNTVARCQKSGKLFPDALVYHSRFQYIHRNGRRAGVDPKEPDEIKGIRDLLVEGFQAGSSPEIRAVTTQVAEMSLDISATKLITEVCPPTSMIQRFGRCNRVLRPSEPAEVLIYLPDGMDNGLPYSRSHKGWEVEYGGWVAFYKQLERDYPRGISQADLEKRLQEFYKEEETRTKIREAYSNLLRTFPRSLRDGSVTVPVVLRSTLEEFKKKEGRDMGSSEVRWVAIPAVLNTAQRKELRAGENVLHRHYVLDDCTSKEFVYDDRLGLLNMKKLGK